jgi:hypothetical protein
VPHKDVAVPRIPEFPRIDLVVVLSADIRLVYVFEVLAASDDGAAGGLAAKNGACSHAADVTDGQGPTCLTAPRHAR